MWKLVLLCGLLAGTSASFLPDLRGALGKVEPVVQKGLDTFDSLGQQLKTELNKFQESGLLKNVRETVQEGKNFLGNIISDVGTLGTKFVGGRILDLKLEGKPDDKSMDLRFPVRANVTMTLPILGQVANLEVSLDLLTSITVEDVESEHPTLTQGKCRSDPASFKLILLDGKIPAINNLLNTVVSLVQRTVSLVVQKAMCPLIHSLINARAGIIIKGILEKIDVGVQAGI
ncbi:BPI fold-containing family A member 2-like [Sorex araneus]|uniref:BPI fold-containing family A member 2-like n=1 Tax=Sorex araneus TaxID=42254 RepID=UPI002433674E|nr:BPI fold-containing family A member 2-like [Sorex araneus]XP_054996616.1 BPI fold-containing family A member 2-like [Sorex araneus]